MADRSKEGRPLFENYTNPELRTLCTASVGGWSRILAQVLEHLPEVVMPRLHETYISGFCSEVLMP